MLTQHIINSEEQRATVSLAKICCYNCTQRHNEGSIGARCPGGRKVPTMSQVLFSMQHICSMDTEAQKS